MITVERVQQVDGITGYSRLMWCVMAPLEWCAAPRYIGVFWEKADADALAALLAKRA